MAVLRPDQAQLTFGAEVIAGADADILKSASYGGDIAFTTVEAGSLSVIVNNTANFKVGDIIIIGGWNGSNNHNLANPAAGATRSIAHSEVRKVEHVEGTSNGTLVLDRPLAFKHWSDDGASSAAANRLSRLVTINPTATIINKTITFVPGVYETVDTPDPMLTIEPRYFLGTQAKRNFTSVYAGQHTYQGALSGCILLNGWPLRWPIGQDIPQSFGGVVSFTGNTLGAAATAGDIWIKTGQANTTPANIDVGDYIVIGYEGSPNMNSLMEIRKVKKIVSSNQWVELETPLRHSHASGAQLREWPTTSSSKPNYVTHHIVERTDLDSLSMHLHMRDSSETATNDFDRRWIGGKVGAMSIIGEEGGLVTVNWDNLVFKDMLHNQPRHAGSTRYDPTNTVDAEGAAVEANMPGYAVMNDIVEADINFPQTQPYYFSEGTVSMFGTNGTPQEFARIRSFAITVNNNEDQRYYITQRYGSHRGPSEIREQRREYTMSCTVALPDTQLSTDNTLDNAMTIFKELLLEGRYDTQNMKGFNIALKFIRGSGTLTGDADDALYIDIPGPPPGQASFETPGTPNPTGATLGTQGAFLRSAPHTIMTEAPFQVACDFVFRNIAIVVRDSEPVYP